MLGKLGGVNVLWLEEREEIVTVTAIGLQLIILTFIHLDLLGEGRKAREVKTQQHLESTEQLYCRGLKLKF